jgi:hypothetical protein
MKTLRVLVTVVAISVSGCVPTVSPEQRAETLAGYTKMCQSEYGIKSGTTDMSQCVMILDQRAGDKADARRVAFAQGMTNFGNNMSANARANQAVTCNQRYLGNGNYTTTCQ